MSAGRRHSPADAQALIAGTDAEATAILHQKMYSGFVEALDAIDNGMPNPLSQHTSAFLSLSLSLAFAALLWPNRDRGGSCVACSMLPLQELRYAMGLAGTRTTLACPRVLHGSIRGAPV